MYVKQQLVSMYGEQAVKTGGLQVVTTLDSAKQKLAETVVANADAGLRRSGADNTSLVAIDPKTGDILAMMGSRNYFDQSRDGNVNVAVTLQQPGSAFKPIIYATGFEKGWAPGSTLFDFETNFGDAKFPYVPHNYDNKSHGPVSIRYALANSFNIPAVKMLALVGKEEAIATANKLGIASLKDPEKYGLSMAIGGGDMTLTELTGAYGVFANNGLSHAPHAITKVTQRGNTLFEASRVPQPIFRPQTAYEINSILSDTEARSFMFGRRGSLYVPNRTVAAKTGTSQDYRDAWTVGYIPSLVVGVWVGNNDNSPMRAGSAGAMAAAPIWNSYLSQALAGTPNESFSQPDGLQVLTVDAITGKQPTEATRQTRQDVFASWQVQGQIQPASYKIYGCDGAVVGTGSTSVVRSEMPGNPNWEKPVLAWAAQNGYATHVSDIRRPCVVPTPQVTLSAPRDSGARITPPTPVVNTPPSSSSGGAPQSGSDTDDFDALRQQILDQIDQQRNADRSRRLRDVVP